MDQTTGHEIAGHENAGHENARQKLPFVDSEQLITVNYMDNAQFHRTCHD